MKRGLWFAFPLVMAMGCGGGGAPANPGGTPLTDSALYAKAVQDYNGKAYVTAKGEFQELLGRPTATAYFDKSTIYIAAIDYHQGNSATCLSVLGSPAPPTSGFFLSFPASTELDRARYWHGRCELGLAPPAYLAARADFTAVIGMAATTYADNAYFWRGRTYYATALASGSETSGDWSSALGDFSAVIGSFGTSTTAPEAKYWLGRTHFARAELAKGRGTVDGDTLAQAELALAATELTEQPSQYPGNSWAADAAVYLGRTHFEQASYATGKVAAYTVAVNDLSPLLGTAALVRDEANYWYGRALHELGLAHETAATPDFLAAKARLDEATAQLRKFQTDTTLSTSKLADNASYWVGRCLFSLADLLKTQAATAADYLAAQDAYATAEAQLLATKTNSQFTTSNVLDWVQVYLGRSQYEQGLCAENRMAGSGATPFATAAASFQTYFTQFGATHASAAAAYYWRGRTYYAQANLALAIAEFNAVVNGWDYVGVSSTTKATTTWWDNAQYHLVLAHSDQAGASCTSAQASYDALKAALPADPLLGPACTYMKDPTRCPSNTCP